MILQICSLLCYIFSLANILNKNLFRYKKKTQSNQIKILNKFQRKWRYCRTICVQFSSRNNTWTLSLSMYDGIEVIRRTLLLCIIFEELQLRAETWLSFSFQKYLLISEIYLESKNLSQQINCYYNLLKTTFPYAAIYWIHVKLSAPICTTLLSNDCPFLKQRLAHFVIHTPLCNKSASLCNTCSSL